MDLPDSSTVEPQIGSSGAQSSSLDDLFEIINKENGKNQSSVEETHENSSDSTEISSSLQENDVGKALDSVVTGEDSAEEAGNHQISNKSANIVPENSEIFPGSSNPRLEIVKTEESNSKTVPEMTLKSTNRISESSETSPSKVMLWNPTMAGDTSFSEMTETTQNAENSISDDKNPSNSGREGSYEDMQSWQALVEGQNSSVELKKSMENQTEEVEGVKEDENMPSWFDAMLSTLANSNAEIVEVSSRNVMDAEVSTPSLHLKPGPSNSSKIVQIDIQSVSVPEIVSYLPDSSSKEGTPVVELNSGSSREQTPMPESGMNLNNLPKLTARSKSGYVLFSAEMRKSVMDANPNKSFGEISKFVGAEWKKLPANKKEEYEFKARQIVKERERLGLTSVNSRILRPGEIRVYYCKWQKCDYQFNNADGLFEHIKHQHTTQKFNGEMYECLWTACLRFRTDNKMILTYPNLLRHIKEKHVMNAGAAKTRSMLGKHYFIYNTPDPSKPDSMPCPTFVHQPYGVPEPNPIACGIAIPYPKSKHGVIYDLQRNIVTENRPEVEIIAENGPSSTSDTKEYCQKMTNKIREFVGSKNPPIGCGGVSKGSYSTGMLQTGPFYSSQNSDIRPNPSLTSSYSTSQGQSITYVLQSGPSTSTSSSYASNQPLPEGYIAIDASQLHFDPTTGEIITNDAEIGPNSSNMGMEMAGNSTIVYQDGMEYANAGNYPTDMEIVEQAIDVNAAPEDAEIIDAGHNFPDKISYLKFENQRLEAERESAFAHAEDIAKQLNKALEEIKKLRAEKLNFKDAVIKNLNVIQNQQSEIKQLKNENKKLKDTIIANNDAIIQNITSGKPSTSSTTTLQLKVEPESPKKIHTVTTVRQTTYSPKTKHKINSKTMSELKRRLDRDLEEAKKKSAAQEVPMPNAKKSKELEVVQNSDRPGPLRENPSYDDVLRDLYDVPPLDSIHVDLPPCPDIMQLPHYPPGSETPVFPKKLRKK